MNRNRRNIALSFVLIIFVLVSCKHTNSSSEEVSILNNKDSTILWENNIIKFGDTMAYKQLSRLFSLNLRYRELLFYAQLMCNKYNNAEACYTCYEINSEVFTPINLRTNDSITLKIGTFYLLKSYELGYERARYPLKKLYKEAKIPNQKEYVLEIIN